MSEQLNDCYAEIDILHRIIQARDHVIERLDERVRELERRLDPSVVAELIKALQFYADFQDGVWENCEDDGKHGLFRKYITGTCHPREIARRALVKASITVGAVSDSADSIGALRCEQVGRGEE